MKWHFICVLLETDAYHYCVYEDILNQINQSNLSANVSICWDSSVNKDTIYHFFNAEKETNWSYSRATTQNQKKLVGDFVNAAVNTFPNSQRTVFLLYVHGNVWFYRHKHKLHSFYNLLSEVNYKFDVIILDSCYVASIEMCKDMKQYTNILVVSEYRHSKMTTMTFNVFSTASTIKDGKEMGLITAIDYINKMNNWTYPEFILETYSDVSVINLEKFDLLYDLLIDIDLITNTTNDMFKNAKVCPKKDKNLLNYDIYTIVVSKHIDKSKEELFKKLFTEVVLYYGQTNSFKKYKWWSKNLHGLSWSPCPWDSTQAWTYKYTCIYPDHKYWTI
jgi:hypothetical protein